MERARLAAGVTHSFVVSAGLGLLCTFPIVTVISTL